MHILGISGSPRGRNSNTLKLVERVLEGAKSVGAETELVDISDVNVAYCEACQACHVSGACSLTDEFPALHEKMLACDGLVLGSPVYFSSVTAQLKTVIDRLAHTIHCQMFLGKYGCSVATSGGPESDSTISYMNDVLVRLGCTTVGGVAATMSVPGSLETAEENALALGRDLVAAFESKRAYPEQDAVHAAMHERFKWLVTANRENWPNEYEYWCGRNWL